MDFQEKHEAPVSLVALAIQNDDVSSLSRLLENGSPTDVPDKRGWYPIHEAAAGGSLKCAEVLMQHAVQTGTPSPLNALTHKCQSPLMIACGNGHENIVNYLVGLKADKGLISTDGATAAHAIFDWGYRRTSVSDAKALQMLRKVILKGSCASMTDSSGCNVLHHTIEMGLLKTFRFLLDEIGLSYKEPKALYNLTPIFLCADFGRCDMLKAIIHKLELRTWTSKEIKARDAIPGRTLPSYLRYWKPPKAPLLDEGDSDNMSPLCAAIRKKNFEMCQLLLRYGANPLAGYYDELGTWVVPLRLSIHLGCTDLLKLVTDHIDMERLAVEGYKAEINGGPAFLHPVLQVLRDSPENAEDMISILADHSAFMKVVNNTSTSILANVLGSMSWLSCSATVRVRYANITKILLEHGSSFMLKGVAHSPFICSPFSNVIAGHFLAADERTEQCNLTSQLFTSPIKLNRSLRRQSLSKLTFFSMILHGADICFNSISDNRTFTLRTRHRLWKKKMLDYLHPQKKSITQSEDLLGLLQDEPREDELGDEFGGPKSLLHLSRLAVRAALGRKLFMEPFPYPTLVNPRASPGECLDPMQHKAADSELPSPICSLDIPTVLKGYLLLEDVAILFFCPRVRIMLF